MSEKPFFNLDYRVVDECGYYTANARFLDDDNKVHCIYLIDVSVASMSPLQFIEHVKDSFQAFNIDCRAFYMSPEYVSLMLNSYPLD